MGKRGPASKGEYAGKSQVLSTRIRPDTRQALQDATKKTGRSLSQEIEHRLRRTFIEDEKIADAFGGRRNYLMMRIAALALQSAHNPQNLDGDWLSAPFTFEQAIRTLNSVLEAIRPPGDIPKRDGDVEELLAQGMPISTAAGIWMGIQEADPALPLQEGTIMRHLAGVLKIELGEIANRPRMFKGTADDLRRHADELEAAERKETAARTKRQPIKRSKGK